MGEIRRAKDMVLACLPDGIEPSVAMHDALDALYTLGHRLGESDADSEWESRLEALRHLARRATEFESEGTDPDVTYPLFKEALEAWWESCE